MDMGGPFGRALSSRVLSVSSPLKANLLRATRLASLVLVLLVGAVLAPPAQAGCDAHLFRLASEMKFGQPQPPPAAEPLPERPPSPAPCHGPRCSHLPQPDSPIPAAPMPSTADDPACLA